MESKFQSCLNYAAKNSDIQECHTLSTISVSPWSQNSLVGDFFKQGLIYAVYDWIFLFCFALLYQTWGISQTLHHHPIPFVDFILVQGNFRNAAVIGSIPSRNSWISDVCYILKSHLRWMPLSTFLFHRGPGNSCV